MAKPHPHHAYQQYLQQSQQQNQQEPQYQPDEQDPPQWPTPSPPKNIHEGRTHNLVHLVRMTGSGDLFAIRHPHKKTGYKSRSSYGFRPVFQDETTNSYFQNTVIKNKAEVLRHRKLVPYNPNAPCNRSPETFNNIIGSRYNDCRNASYLRLSDGNPKHMRTPKTTNQLFMHYNLNPVGDSNPAIFSEKAKRMHRAQCEG